MPPESAISLAVSFNLLLAYLDWVDVVVIYADFLGFCEVYIKTTFMPEYSSELVST